MKNVIQGATTAQTAVAPTLHLGTYRRALLAVIIGNPLFTDAEQVLANHNAHECRDAQRLALWTRNTLRVAKEREAAATATPRQADLLAILNNPARVCEADLAEAHQLMALWYPFCYQVWQDNQAVYGAAAPTGNLLADLQNPAFVAQHGSKQAAAGFPTLTVADAYKAAESLRQAFAASAAQQQPTAPTEQPAAPTYATAAQCDEVYRLACQLPAREKADALRRLPKLTEPEAAALIRGLNLRRGCRLRVPMHLAGRATCVLIPERHLIAARVDYVREGGRVVPLYETSFGGGGALVQRVWAN